MRAVLDQILVDVSDALTARFPLPAAVIAGHAAHAQMTAGAAFAERVTMFLQARSMGGIGGALISMAMSIRSDHRGGRGDGRRRCDPE